MGERQTRCGGGGREMIWTKQEAANFSRIWKQLCLRMQMFLFLRTVRQDHLLRGSPVLLLLNFCFYTEKEDVRLSFTNSSRLPMFSHWKQLYRGRAVLRSLGRSTGRTGTYGIMLVLSFVLSGERIPNHGGIKVLAHCVGRQFYFPLMWSWK